MENYLSDLESIDIIIDVLEFILGLIVGGVVVKIRSNRKSNITTVTQEKISQKERGKVLGRDDNSSYTEQNRKD